MNINRRSHWIILCLTAACVCACTTESLPEMQEDLCLRIRPFVSDVVPTTRLSINTPTFEKGANIAMFIFPKDGYNPSVGIDASPSYPPIPQYNRVDVYISNKGDLSYTPVGFTTPTPSLYLKKNAGPVDVYAYHPNTSEKAIYLEAIPFTLGNKSTTNYDYMLPIEGVQTVDPASYTGNNCDLPLTFYHIMSQLEFRFTPSFWGQDLFPTFHLKCTRNGQPIEVIGTKGTYSYTTGIVTPTAWASEQVFSGEYIPILGSLAPSAQGVIFPPIELSESDDDIIISVEISFNEQKPGQDPVPIQTEPYQISLKSLTAGTDGNKRYGLLPGYKYVINVKIDNFVKYSGVPSMVKWTDVPMEIPI